MVDLVRRHTVAWVETFSFIAVRGRKSLSREFVWTGSSLSTTIAIKINEGEE